MTNKRKQPRQLHLGELEDQPRLTTLAVADNAFGSRDELLAKNERLESTYEDLKQRAALVRNEDGSLSLQGCIATEAGLTVPETISREDYLLAAETLFTLDRHVQVLIGDLLVADDSLQYGDMGEYAKHFGYEVETLYNWKSICKKVEISLRNEVVAETPGGKLLGIAHYNLVKSLDSEEQRYWLIRARQENLTTRQLLEAMKQTPSEPRSAFDLWFGRLAKLGKTIPEMPEHERQKIIEELEKLLQKLKSR